MSDLKRVLVVDDEAPQRDILNAILSGAGWDVATAADAKGAMRALDPVPPDVILTDLKMAGKDGLDLLADLRRTAPGIPVILMTAHGTVETAVRAMKEGAFDYLTKPLGRDELLITLSRALDRVQLERQNRELREALEERLSDRNIIADHGSMRGVLKLVEKVAPSSSTVLIYGETGTGKEVIARAIHQKSRRKGPFVAINCAAIPENLLESELFGHEKGAFTGAAQRKIGLFERAQGGTLFLDEIGDLPLVLQPKLLRALQEREIMRVGGEAPIAIEVRIIAATHRDLAQLLEAKTFREDLFWRLNVFPIKLPPLRERATDIPLLVEHFLARIAKENQRPPKKLAPEAVRALQQYRWPGNVRELQSVMERATLLAEGDEVRVEDLPVEVRTPASKVTLSDHIDFEIPEQGLVFEELERQILAKAMERSGGVIARAAKMLGMSYRTLQYRLEKFGLRGKEAAED
jgi:DNA-binding NtrC family response regulator